MDEFMEMEFEDRINGGIYDEIEDYEVFPAYDDEFWDELEQSDANWLMARYDIENDHDRFDDFECDYE